MVAKKDFNAPKHEDLEDIPNLQVIKAMQSLTSKGYVKTRFSWQYYYYNLTDEGLDYLRGWYVIHQHILFAQRPPSPSPLRVKEPVTEPPL